VADPIVGIDLGTSNSCVAVCDQGGNVKVLADDSGFKVQPSVVSFHPNGSVIVGAEAKQRKVLDPKNTVYSAKRLIGRSFRAREVQTTITRMPYVIREGGNQQPMIVTRAGEFAVPEISAIVLDHMRKIASRATGGDASRAVVTVPASFTEAQRTATATAGAIAGMTIVRVLNEPTAAALAYGHTRQLKKTIAVFDFGGGTFDITVLKLDDNVYEVLGTAGDTFLGGDDIDERVVDQLVAGFLGEHRIDLRQNEIAMMRLRAVAEQTKIELSRRSRAIIKVDEIAYGPGGVPLNLQQELTRDQLVAGCVDVVDRAFPVCDESLRLAGLRTPEVDDVILVGGTTKMPYVRDRVAAYFGKAPRTDINPEEAVAIGAALQAAALERILSKRPSVRVTGAQPIVRADSETTGSGAEITHADAIVPGDSITLDQQSSTTLEVMRHEDTFEEGLPTRPGEAAKQTARGPMGSPRAPARPTGGDRPVERHVAVDRFDSTKMPEIRAPGAPIGRMTKPGAGVPPPVPGGRTLMGVPAQDPPTGTSGRPRTAPIAPPEVPPRRTQPVPGLGPIPGSPAPTTTKPMPSVPTSPATTPGFPDTRAPALRPDPSNEPTAVGAFEVPTRPAAQSAPGLRADPLAEASADAAAARGKAFEVSTRPADLAPMAKASARGATFEEPTRPAAPIPTESVRPLQGEPTRPAAPDIQALLDADVVDDLGGISDADLSDLELDTNVGTSPQAQNPASRSAPGYSSSPGYGSQPGYGSAPQQPSPASRSAPGYSSSPGYGSPQPPPDARSGPGFVPVAGAAAPTLIASASSLGPNMTMRGRVDAPAPSTPLGGTDKGVPPPPMRPDPQSGPNLLMPSMTVIDVTPRAFGIATVAGYCEELIRRNARVPTETRKTFITSRDRQQVVRIRICQGESRRLDDNVIIGDLVLDNIEPRPRGETAIEVTFTIDASGILNVRARDSRSGREQRAALDIVGAQSDAEVAASRERMSQLRR
jgi:molecular chaperone DnaK